MEIRVSLEAPCSRCGKAFSDEDDRCIRAQIIGDSVTTEVWHPDCTERTVSLVHFDTYAPEPGIQWSSSGIYSTED